MEENIEEISTEEKAPDFDTAFIVCRTFDGTFIVTNQLGVKFTVERQANRNDMRQGFRDLLETLASEQVIQGVLAKLSKNSQEDSQPSEDEIRQPLPEESQ